MKQKVGGKGSHGNTSLHEKGSRVCHSHRWLPNFVALEFWLILVIVWLVVRIRGTPQSLDRSLVCFVMSKFTKLVLDVFIVGTDACNIVWADQAWWWQVWHAREKEERRERFKAHFGGAIPIKPRGSGSFKNWWCGQGPGVPIKPDGSGSFKNYV
jgi:hypothetical protein